MSDSPSAPHLTPPVGPTPSLRPRQWAWLPIVAQAALVGVLAAWLGCGLPLGIPGQWAWEVHGRPLPVGSLLRALVIGAEMVGLCCLGLWRTRHRRRSDAGILVTLVVLVLAFQWSIASLAPQAGFYLVAGTGSSVATEYFGVARTVRDPWAYCRTYATTQRSGHHVATHPPGAVLTYWLCLRVYDSPSFPRRAFETLSEQVIGAPLGDIASAANSYPGTSLAPGDVGAALFCCLAFGACAALSVLPLYWLARRAATRSTALVVCCLFALTPAPVLFFQGLDAPILLLAVTALASAYEAVTRRSLWAAALCGLALGLMCTMTFGATASLATVGALAGVLLCRVRGADRPRAWAAVGVGAAVWLGIVVALDLACGGRLPAIFSQAMAAHRELTWEGMERRYVTWVGLNLVEFFVFLGLPALVALTAALGHALRSGRRGLHAGELVGLIGLLVLLALDVSGSVRGEVARVWLLLMPPLILWAGLWVRRALRDAPAAAAATILLSLVQVILLGGFLTPVVLPY